LGEGVDVKKAQNAKNEKYEEKLYLLKKKTEFRKFILHLFFLSPQNKAQSAKNTKQKCRENPRHF
jgi:hypothetical protein